MKLLNSKQSLLTIGILAQIEILDVILTAVALNLADLINDVLLVNLVSHFTVKHYFVFIVAHLVEFFVSELALTLRSNQCHFWLLKQNATSSSVINLVEEVLFRLASCNLLGSETFLGLLR